MKKRRDTFLDKRLILPIKFFPVPPSHIELRATHLIVLKLVIHLFSISYYIFILLPKNASNAGNKFGIRL